MRPSGAQQRITAEEFVRTEWISLLPGERQQLFRDAVVSLEATYMMLSVALDEAMVLRESGQLVQAREHAGVCGELGERLARKLEILFRGMKAHGENMSEWPRVLPLTASNFRHSETRMAAWIHLLQHKLIPSIRLRFFHKLRVLKSTVGGLAKQFKRMAEDIAENRSVRPPVAWSELDSLHYDLNTCLRESIVTLKCFLRLMPEELFLQFQKQMRGMPTSVAEAQAAKLIGTKSAQNLSAQLITPHPPRY